MLLTKKILEFFGLDESKLVSDRTELNNLRDLLIDLSKDRGSQEAYDIGVKVTLSEFAMNEALNGACSADRTARIAETMGNHIESAKLCTLAGNGYVMAIANDDYLLGESRVPKERLYKDAGWAYARAAVNYFYFERGMLGLRNQDLTHEQIGLIKRTDSHQKIVLFWKKVERVFSEIGLDPKFDHGTPRAIYGTLKQILE